MHIECGYTRIVILTDTKAIKIARVGRGIAELPFQAIRSLLDPAWFRQKVEERGGKPARAVLIQLRRVFRTGVACNRQEHRLYAEHPELPLAPVCGIYLGGLVLVMERGEPVSADESAPLRGQYAAWGDLGEPRHTCRIRGKLCLIDYGHPLAPEALSLA